MIRLKLNILVYVGGERHAIVYSRYLVLFHPSLSYLKFKKKNTTGRSFLEECLFYFVPFTDNKCDTKKSNFCPSDLIYNNVIENYLVFNFAASENIRYIWFEN